MATVSRVVVNRSTVTSILGSPSSSIGRKARAIGNAVEVEAKRRVGKRTRRLERDIKARTRLQGLSLAIVVSAPHVPYADVHHEGSRPHVIRPRRGRVLAFRSRNSGQRVVARVVHHPGTRPNRYLTDALRAVQGRHR